MFRKVLTDPPLQSTAAFDFSPGRGYSLRPDACLASASPEALARSLEYLTVFLHQVQVNRFNPDSFLQFRHLNRLTVFLHQVKELRDFTCGVLRSDEVC